MQNGKRQYDIIFSRKSSPENKKYITKGTQTMTSVNETMNKYINKTLSRTEKNADYFAIVRGKNDLCYCTNGNAFAVYSLYAAMDFGSGMTLTTFYDKYISADDIPNFTLAGRGEEVLLCVDDFGYRVIGIDADELEEAEEKDSVCNPKNAMIYFRTKYRHNFVYIDAEHSSVRYVSDTADVDEDGNPRPDAVTSWCVSMFAPKPEETEEKPDGQDNAAGERSEVKTHD